MNISVPTSVKRANSLIINVTINIFAAYEKMSILTYVYSNMCKWEKRKDRSGVRTDEGEASWKNGVIRKGIVSTWTLRRLHL